ncbi:hypothetical protein LSH36_226g02002 [Paralvinella palmiformis]|uniref:Uncharacterized protein n=1 Tax=Paralvinella palmiformis TaxID=53620 RepID=A0AAD9JPW4_9ANNE|nr:hypothetical protein LSH36_226g02002 [Paralvinella palmiformis]
MGCDGGTIPTRDELVKLKKKPEQDVKTLELTINPAYKATDGEKGGVYIDTNMAPYICPVSGLEMNGKYR